MEVSCAVEKDKNNQKKNPQKNSHHSFNLNPKKVSQIHNNNHSRSKTQVKEHDQCGALYQFLAVFVCWFFRGGGGAAAGAGVQVAAACLQNLQHSHSGCRNILSLNLSLYRCAYTMKGQRKEKDDKQNERRKRKKDSDENQWFGSLHCASTDPTWTSHVLYNLGL